MTPGDPVPLKDVLDPNRGPLVSTVVPAEFPPPIVVRDDFGFFGEANVIAVAIKSAAGRNQASFPRWVRITAYVMAACALISVVLRFF